VLLRVKPISRNGFFRRTRGAIGILCQRSGDLRDLAQNNHPRLFDAQKRFAISRRIRFERRRFSALR
jgi:hypothetical protein